GTTSWCGTSIGQSLQKQNRDGRLRRRSVRGADTIVTMPLGARICRLCPAHAAAGAGLAIGLGLASCKAEVTRPSFESPTPKGRAAAVAQAASDRNREAISDLIEALDDSDPVVRSWAIRGLEDLTGRTFGFDPFAPQGLRGAAVARWVRWRQAGG